MTPVILKDITQPILYLSETNEWSPVLLHLLYIGSKRSDWVASFSRCSRCVFHYKNSNVEEET